MRKLLSSVLLLGISSQAYALPSEQEVVHHYADIAQAVYEDSLTTARQLLDKVNVLIEKPSEENLLAARAAWKAARVPYQQSEVYRFGNPIVDEWEGKLNAWPLDEGLIDYVDARYGTESEVNPYYAANIIANKQLNVAGKTIDASVITKELLTSLHEVDGMATNVATGYHAIEFLLWGQDLNGTKPGAGNRPASDYDVKNCKVGNCDRRAQYLQVTTQMLVDELAWMISQWAEQGDARKALLAKGAGNGLKMMFTGMGSLSFGELAGERMKLGLMLHDPEEEVDCFSDNTHSSHYYNALGIKNVYTGRYVRIDGKVVSGPSAAELVAAKDAQADKRLRQLLDVTVAKVQVLVDSAEKEGVAYDQLLAAGNAVGNDKIMAAVNALLDQAKGIESAIAALQLSGIEFEGSDSLK